ncbi:hypothetical protein KLP40_06150 [Hymenobacter sp. NST-14]|uniref:hypothetical protein n=1 Tax=Hymenobacter piscis TaxID=2839984 RepID=UPI001C0247D9|nr:hypothetical protein [Hymenobacter piscis]MBT9392739.1 hypothetical protein [Hymenobacter piscis]
MSLSFKIFARPILLTLLLLAVPLVAMQFTREVSWTFFDFVVMGMLLFGTGLTYELVAARAGATTVYRLGVALGVVAGLLLVWVNLAVGIIGSEANPANLLYLGVLGTVLTGALRARFRAAGLARTMLAAAAVQLLVPLVAALIWQPAIDRGFWLTLAFNGVFALLWAGSALLFYRASHRQPAA